MNDTDTDTKTHHFTKRELRTQLQDYKIQFFQEKLAGQQEIKRAFNWCCALLYIEQVNLYFVFPQIKFAQAVLLPRYHVQEVLRKYHNACVKHYWEIYLKRWCFVEIVRSTQGIATVHKILILQRNNFVWHDIQPLNARYMSNLILILTCVTCN